MSGVCCVRLVHVIVCVMAYSLLHCISSIRLCIGCTPRTCFHALGCLVARSRQNLHMSNLSMSCISAERASFQWKKSWSSCCCMSCLSIFLVVLDYVPFRSCVCKFLFVVVRWCPLLPSVLSWCCFRCRCCCCSFASVFL